MGMNNGAKIGIGVAAVAVVAGGVFAFTRMDMKDPKETVIDAFEDAFFTDREMPVEEIFGGAAFVETAGKESREGGLSLKLESCSAEGSDAFLGSGIRISGRADVENARSDAGLGIIYNGMDLVNLNAYYGDDTLMVAVPELFSKVLTLDLGEGLAERVSASPVVGPYLEESGVDVEGLAAYCTEMAREAQEKMEGGKTDLDLGALMDRYKEGCKAQENFKAAMTVEKGEKGTCTINGSEVTCKGYSVVISKDSMIEFLKTSSDFFLQDETLKEEYLTMLERTVEVSQFMGNTAAGNTMTAEEMQAEAYESAEEFVDEAVTYLENALSDVTMTVFVSKDGKLAAFNGKTEITVEDAGTSETVTADFYCALEGGTYPTQNMNGDLTLTADGVPVDVHFVKQGTYSDEALTCDIQVEAKSDAGEKVTCMYTGTYSKADGSYHVAAEAGDDDGAVFKLSASGTVDELEKGKTIHVALDELRGEIDGDYVTLSGEYYLRPLSGEITVPEGETMDVLAASEADFQGLYMEAAMRVMGLAGQLGAQ